MSNKWLKKDYEGCKNCIHRPEQLQTCGWLKIQKSVSVVCPNWEKKGENNVN